MSEGAVMVRMGEISQEGIFFYEFLTDDVVPLALTARAIDVLEANPGDDYDNDEWSEDDDYDDDDLEDEDDDFEDEGKEHDPYGEDEYYPDDEPEYEDLFPLEARHDPDTLAGDE